MKRIVLVLFLFTAFMSLAWAKYNRPEDVTRTRADKSAQYMFNYMDKDNDGKLTLEEYKTKRITGDVKRDIHYEKANGIYKTPEEEFKIMDADEDGFITQEDLAGYTREKYKLYNK